jgi:penicillin-binding protein 1A
MFLRFTNSKFLHKIEQIKRDYELHLKNRIPKTVILCLIVAEDHRFYLHHGADPIAITSAIVKNMINKHIRGASTIEQQFVRIVTCRYEITIKRKIKEIFLATTLPNIYSKIDIAGMYLSVAYFGWRMNGIVDACKRLNFDLSTITFDQCAALIDRLKYPEPKLFNETRYKQISQRTKKILLKLQLQNDFFSV